ncbi:MAG: phosphoglucomutase/phosphomannomutase family protein [Halobacteriales archaeon]
MDDADAITFGTDGWRATLETFTTPRVRMVGQAVATYIDEQGDPEAPVMVGYDARETSRGFAEELARVLAANGHDVLLPERDRPTPVIAWAVVDRGLAGALMVTASHNPPEYNGVKFIPADGAPALPAVTEVIEARLALPDPKPESAWGTVREVDVVTPHARQARDLIEADLTGVTVVYDAMHGSGRGVTDALLEAAGATVVRRRCSRDPDFGGTPPEPSPDHLTDLVKSVGEHNADLGLANDGDADRIAAVTPERGCLDGNRFFAAIYDYLLEDATGPAIRTVSTTFLIDRIADAHGESVHETPVGFKWVADAMADHDALFGGEESGGYSMRGHVREKDGVLMALLATAATADRSLDARLDALFAEHGEIHQDKRSIDCPDDEKERVITALGDELPGTVAGEPVEEVNDADGFKILLADGSWLLIRPSGTEPVLRIYAEAQSQDRVAELLTAGQELVTPLM